MQNKEMNTGLDSFDTKPSSFLIIETADLFNDLQAQCQAVGEQSAVDFDDERELDYFVDELCSNISYQPLPYVKGGIETLLVNHEEFLSHGFTEYQKGLWRTVGLELWGYFNQLGLYDHEGVNRYEYDRMLGNSVILRLYREGGGYGP